jgi:flagellar biosynthetic protein FliO
VKSLLVIAFCLAFACILSASTPPKAETEKPAPPAPTAVAVVEPVPQPASVVDPPGDEYHALTFRAIGGLGLVLCLIAAGYFGVKKFAPQYFAKSSSEKNLKVLETLSMGDKRSISIIQVANHRYLVGNTAHQINFLTSLPEKLSLVSEVERPEPEVKKELKKEGRNNFRGLFEAEKNRSAAQSAHPLPEDLRTKMRQLREALERG